MLPEKNLYERLLEQGVPKQNLHKILHYLLMEQIKNSPKLKPPFAAKIKRLPLNIFQSLKNLKLNTLLKDKALTLLKTQFAKKPKNPV